MNKNEKMRSFLTKNFPFYFGDSWSEAIDACDIKILNHLIFYFKRPVKETSIFWAAIKPVTIRRNFAKLLTSKHCPYEKQHYNYIVTS